MVPDRDVGRRIAHLAPAASVTASVSRGGLAVAAIASQRRRSVRFGGLGRVATGGRRLDDRLLYSGRRCRDQECGVIRFEIFHDPVLFELGPVPLTKTMVTSFGVSLVLVVIAATMRAAVLRHPAGKLAAATEMTFESIEQLVTDVVGRPVPWLVIFAGSLFLFIAACNFSGQLPGLQPPTANLVTTSALAVVVFITVPVAGILSQGLVGYLKHYFKPNPLLFPLHLISEVTRTFALSMRLFGNMMSGHLIVALLVALAGFLVPAPLMALDLLIGLLQAYIFTLLSIVYIGAALREEESESPS
jgi:F-type H+-transporting ATPase subunit a